MGIIGFIALCAFVYGMYWIFKTVSYEIFYESMVQETIKEMVKSKFLKGD